MSPIEEEQEKRSALWSAVIATQDGDVLVVDARGNMQTGCLGAMLMTSIHAKGTRGLVVDGCIRDLPAARELGLLTAARDTLTKTLRRKKNRSDELMRALRYERVNVISPLRLHRASRSFITGM